jgi:S-adenosylmethionine hydrolase
MHPRPSGLVTLLTDFGLADPYVGILKGAAFRAATKVAVVSVTHAVPPQDIATGAFFVRTIQGRFPPGTVHVVVVDPGVGTSRRLLAVAAHDDYWIGPDNGVLSAVLGGEVRAIDAAHLGLHATSTTFHGRDLLAPVAAWLATGRYGFASLGPRITDPVPGPSFDGPPRVVHVDGYGNLITNVPAERLASVQRVVVAGRDVPLVRTYGEAPAGALVALVGSYGLLEVAQNGGNAAMATGSGRGASIELFPA